MMIKKLSLALTAVAVVAFGVPAVSSASKMTMPANTLVAVNTPVTFLSHNTVIETEFGIISCNVVTLKAKVTKNNGTAFEGVEEAGSTATPCFFEGIEIEVTNPTLRIFSSSVAGVGRFSLIFRVDLPGNIVCTFEEVVVPFTYVGGASVLHLEGLLEGGACGLAEITGDFTVETTAGGFVTLD